MHETNLAGIDLNLLIALEALLAEAHVGRAASRIGLSQPATSHALRRLRDLFGDPLLVRTRSRMEPTPRAEALRLPLARALHEIRGLLVPSAFDPATSSRRFVLMMPDLVAELILPPLVGRAGKSAPGVRFELVPWLGHALSIEAMRTLDLVISYSEHDFPGFHSTGLYDDSDALAVRAGRPMSAQLSTEHGFRAGKHVGVVARGEREDPIDAWLRTLGVERDLALVVPTYLQALHIAARTDLVAFLPTRLIDMHTAALGALRLAPPFPPGPDRQCMFYPTRLQADPASRWLRSLVRDICRDLPAEITRGRTDQGS